MMSTRSAIVELSSALAATRRCLGEVRQSAGDYPVAGGTGPHAYTGHASGAVVVVDLLQDACEELDGWLLSAAAAVNAARQAAMFRRTALIADQVAEAAEATNRAFATYVTGIGGVDSITRLRELAVDQGGAWQKWSWTVLGSIGPVWTHLTFVRSALDQCWRELVEHLLGDPVEVRTTPRSNGNQANEVLTGGQ